MFSASNNPFWVYLIWFILLCSMLLDEFKVQSSTLCDTIDEWSFGPIPLQAATIFHSELHLVVRNQSYSVPLPSSRFTSLTIDSNTKYFGNWEQLTWLVPFSTLKPMTAILSAQLYFIKSNPTFTSVWYRSQSQPQQCTFHLDQTNHTKNSCQDTTKFSRLGALSNAHGAYIYLVQKVETMGRQLHTPFKSALVWLVPGNSFSPLHNIGSAFEFTFQPGTITIRSADSQTLNPTNDYRPFFGFIHADQVHLWIPQDHHVVIFEDAHKRLGQIMEGQQVNLSFTMVPFEKYFVCPKGEAPVAKDDRSKKGFKSVSELLPLILIAIFSIAIIFMLGLLACRRKSHPLKEKHSKRPNTSTTKSDLKSASLKHIKPLAHFVAPTFLTLSHLPDLEFEEEVEENPSSFEGQQETFSIPDPSSANSSNAKAKSTKNCSKKMKTNKKRSIRKNSKKSRSQSKKK